MAEPIVPEDRAPQFQGNPITRQEVEALNSCITYLAAHRWNTDNLFSLYRKLVAIQTGGAK